MDNQNDDDSIKISYNCSACTEVTTLGLKDTVKCKKCGVGVLLKRRDPKKVVQLFAI